MALAATLKHLVIVFVIIYAISPIVFRHSIFVQRNLIFMTFLNTRYDRNLSQPEGCNLKCTRTLTILNSNDNVKLGVWHVVPESKVNSCKTTSHNNRTFIDDKLAFDDSRPIVLYNHGNGGDRAGTHRTELYEKLAYEMDYHVVTFDYRSFGDSSGHILPSADGVTSDARAVYNWLLSHDNVTRDRIRVWGHSLGTGIATKLVAEMSPDEQPPRLVLEAPFDSMENAVRNHPFSAPFRILPYYEYFFVEPFRNTKIFNFNSAKSVETIKSTKILILHAEDDGILPFPLGKSLYEAANRALGDPKVQFYPVDAKHGLGHKHICRHTGAMKLVQEFLS